jgi:hypothetical protein
MSEVPFVHARDLTTTHFLERYVAANVPVVVGGALDSWDLEETWTPAALGRLVGDAAVQVYGDDFELRSVMVLSKYLSKYMGKDANASMANAPYVRWYSKFRDVPFWWADEALSRLRPHLRLPSFLPTKDYILPPTATGTPIDPVVDAFPAKGLFISPRSARTKRHVDPWSSCAILLQLHGQKQWTFYSPDHAKSEGSDTVASCTLSAGEAIYVPHGWAHEVECISDSVSLTWNFVHHTTLSSFKAWLRRPLSKFDASVLKFFYQLPDDCDVQKLVFSRIDSLIGC